MQRAHKDPTSHTHTDATNTMAAAAGHGINPAAAYNQYLNDPTPEVSDSLKDNTASILVEKPYQVFNWEKMMMRAAANPALNNRNKNLASLIKSDTLLDGTVPSAEEKQVAADWLKVLLDGHGPYSLIAEEHKANANEMLTAVKDYAKAHRETKKFNMIFLAYIKAPHGNPDDTSIDHHQSIQRARNNLTEFGLLPAGLVTEREQVKVLTEVSDDKFQQNMFPYLNDGAYDAAVSAVTTGTGNIRQDADLKLFFGAAENWTANHPSTAKDASRHQPDAPDSVHNTDQDTRKSRRCRFGIKCRAGPDKCPWDHSRDTPASGSANQKKGGKPRAPTGPPDDNGGTKGAEKCRNWAIQRCYNKGKQCNYQHVGTGGYRSTTKNPEKFKGKAGGGGGSRGSTPTTGGFKKPICADFLKGDCTNSEKCPNNKFHNFKLRVLMTTVPKVNHTKEVTMEVPMDLDLRAEIDRQVTARLEAAGLRPHSE
jgi:hypothetical protein